DSHMTDDITDLTVGIPHPFFLDDINEEVEANFRQVKGLLRRAGVKVYDIHIPDVDKMLDAQKIIIAYESYQVHEENVNRFPDDWDPEVKERIEKSVQTKEAYTEALKRKYTFKEIFRTAMKDVDALVTPTISIPTPDIDQRVIHHSIGDGEKVTADVRSSITQLTAPTNSIEKSVQTKEAYTEALKRKYTFKEIFRTAMKDVDALVTPTISIPTPDIDQRVIHHSIGDGEKVTADVRSSITRLTAPTNIIG